MVTVEKVSGEWRETLLLPDTVSIGVVSSWIGSSRVFRVTRPDGSVLLENGRVDG